LAAKLLDREQIVDAVSQALDELPASLWSQHRHAAESAPV